MSILRLHLADLLIGIAALPQRGFLLLCDHKRDARACLLAPRRLRWWIIWLFGGLPNGSSYLPQDEIQPTLEILVALRAEWFRPLQDDLTLWQREHVLFAAGGHWWTT